MSGYGYACIFMVDVNSDSLPARDMLTIFSFDLEWGDLGIKIVKLKSKICQYNCLMSIDILLNAMPPIYVSLFEA